MDETTPRIDPAHSALLVMDYQAAILGSFGGSDELLERAVAAIRTTRAYGVHIGYVRVAFDDADFAAVPQTNRSFSLAAVARRMHNEAPESAIHDAVAPELGDILVRKTRVGAFSTTDLDGQLRGRQIDTLILAGVATGGVVLSTVRDAADRDYRVYVLEDACADRDLEVHDLLMRKVFPRQAYVVSTADLPGLLGAPR